MIISKNISQILAVFAGGGMGALIRYGFSTLIKQNSVNFPWATFFVNASGCFFIGLLFNLIKTDSSVIRLLLIVGFLGGFTTFSTFANETYQLIIAGKYSTAFFYVFLSNIICFISVYVGAKFTSIF